MLDFINYNFNLLILENLNNGIILLFIFSLILISLFFVILSKIDEIIVRKLNVWLVLLYFIILSIIETYFIINGTWWWFVLLNLSILFIFFILISIFISNKAFLYKTDLEIEKEENNNNKNIINKIKNYFIDVAYNYYIRHIIQKDTVKINKNILEMIQSIILFYLILTFSAFTYFIVSIVLTFNESIITDYTIPYIVLFSIIIILLIFYFSAVSKLRINDIEKEVSFNERNLESFKNNIINKVKEKIQKKDSNITTKTNSKIYIIVSFIIYAIAIWMFFAKDMFSDKNLLIISLIAIILLPNLLMPIIVNDIIKRKGKFNCPYVFITIINLLTVFILSVILLFFLFVKPL